MSETYPLFKSALASSTPFPGTMAETGTPTPAGMQPQTPQTPQATEMPGVAGNQERMKKIQEDRDLIHQQIHTLQNLKWVPTDQWGNAVHVALNGKNIEPAGMMYKRYNAMQELLKVDATLAEEQRLLTTPSPTKQADISEALGRERRQGFVAATNARNKAEGKPTIPPEIEYQFIEKAYSLDQALRIAGMTEDQIKALTAGANFGQEVGAKSAMELLPPGKQQQAAVAGANYAQRQAEEKKKQDQKPLPVLGLFEKPGDLLKAMHQDFIDTIKTDDYSHMEQYKIQDAFGMETTRERRAPSSAEEIKNARAAVASRWPGYEKYFPNFVEKGFTDVPAVDPAQADVDVNKVRQQLKEKASGASK